MRINNLVYRLIDDGSKRAAHVTSLKGDSDNSLEVKFSRPFETITNGDNTTYVTDANSATIFPEEGKTLVIDDKEYKFHTKPTEFKNVCDFCSFRNRLICLRVSCYKRFFVTYTGNV